MIHIVEKHLGPANHRLLETMFADALRAPWMAVHVETSRSEGFDEAAKRRVAASLALAATLGATIATVPAESIVAGLRSQIEGMRATQVVIGKSQRSWWFEFRHGSVVDALVKGAQGVAVHVIPSVTEGGAHPIP